MKVSHGPEKVRCDRLKVGLKESKPATDGSCVWVPSLSRGRQKVKSLTGLVKDASVSNRLPFSSWKRADLVEAASPKPIRWAPGRAVLVSILPDERMNVVPVGGLHQYRWTRRSLCCV